MSFHTRRISPPSPMQDYLPYVLLFLSILLSLASFLAFWDLGLITKYPDAQAHLLIARRVCNGSSPGLAQLGAVWLPLTHVLSLPLVCADQVLKHPAHVLTALAVFAIGFSLIFCKVRSLYPQRWVSITMIVLATEVILLLVFSAFAGPVLYTSGLAQSLISMLSFVLMGQVLYHFVKEWSGSKGAAVVAWILVMFNPNMLYMQSTPMTELPLYFGMVASMYTFWRLMREPSNFTWLFWGGVSSFIMTTIRYEGWFLLLIQTVLYLVVLRRYKFKVGDALGHLVQWSTLAFIGVGGWLAWNLTIFGSPMEFQNGVYAKPSNWVVGNEASFGNLDVAFQTYVWGAWNTLGPIVLVALVGLLVYVASTRLRKDSWAPLVPLALFPFFVFMIYKGQRPMKAEEVEGVIYNARFALSLIVSVAPLVAYLTKWHRILQGIAVVLILGSYGWMFANNGIITLKEPIIAERADFSQLQLQAVEWLQINYTGQPALMESFGNDQLQFLAQMDLSNVIYEGSYKVWEQALQDPASWNIEIVIMRGSENADQINTVSSLTQDLVWQTLRAKPEFHEQYRIVFRNSVYEIYARRGPND